LIKRSGPENSDLFDEDILFNPPAWNALVETQRELFRIAALETISDRLRQEFYHGHAADREMPEIARSDWNTPLLDAYADQPIGYDLPCLLSAERPTIGRIILCAQDPLRGPGPAKLTVGTFFGIDSNYHRTRRHWGMIWQLIRHCVMQGYDVWVTDAIKLFAGKKVLSQDSRLRELCYATIRDEVSAIDPTKVVAFGSWASDAISAAGVNVSFLRVPHPTARGLRGTMQERLEGYRSLILD
jgi:hypothetical protein